MGGPTKLVVSGSGHIAGVVNPPAAGKYQYWTNDGGAETLEDWLAGATETAGSWWPNWLEWIAAQSGTKVKAHVPVDVGLGDAPGEFVRVKVSSPAPPTLRGSQGLAPQGEEII